MLEEPQNAGYKISNDKPNDLQAIPLPGLPGNRILHRDSRSERKRKTVENTSKKKIYVEKYRKMIILKRGKEEKPNEQDLKF